jgi:nucleotide-binding universal stress UspA family protein
MGTHRYARVVIPLDGERHHDHAALIGAQIAKRIDVPAELFSVVSTGLEAVDAAELSRQAEALPGTVTARVVPGVDLTALHELTASPDVLVCLATSARTAVAEAIAGSGSASVLRLAKEPVLVIGPECEPNVDGTEMAIAVDGSSASELIVAPALQLAAALRLRPTLYHVRPESAASADDCDGYVAALAARIGTAELPVGHAVLLDHKPGRALARLAQTEDVAVMALASHASDVLDRLLTPSVTFAVLRSARCPVLVGSRVVPDEPVFDHGTGARVVVGIEGSGADSGALAVAVDEALARGAALELVHAWSFPWVIADDGAVTIGAIDEAQASAQQVLDRAVAAAKEHAAEVNVLAWLTRQTPSAALLAAAKGAELLVVGEHHFNLVEEGFFGSTMRYVTHHSPIPVLVVPEWIDTGQR